MKKSRRVPIQPRDSGPTAAEDMAYRVGALLGFSVFSFLIWGALFFPIGLLVQLVSWLVVTAGTPGISSVLGWGQSFAIAGLLALTGFLWSVFNEVWK